MVRLLTIAHLVFPLIVDVVDEKQFFLSFSMI